MSSELLPDNEEELREIVVSGRDCETAKRVFSDFIADWREEIVRKIETTPLTDEQLQSLAIQLRGLNQFWQMCKREIELGKMAAKEMNKRYGR